MLVTQTLVDQIYVKRMFLNESSMNDEIKPVAENNLSNRTIKHIFSVYALFCYMLLFVCGLVAIWYAY